MERLLLQSWLAAHRATALLEAAQRDLTWQQRDVRLFGRTIAQPRLVALLGRGYGYSGLQLSGGVAPSWFTPLLSRVNAETGDDFNSVLFNLYRDGRDSIGWHSDDERELGSRPVVASLSLGAERLFQIRHKTTGQRSDVMLRHGDLLVMPAGFQDEYQHAMAKTKAPTGPRVSLTFRRIG